MYVRKLPNFPHCETFIDAIDEFILKTYHSEQDIRENYQSGVSKAFIGGDMLHK